jgi:hypothetical protein
VTAGTAAYEESFVQEAAEGWMEVSEQVPEDAAIGGVCDHRLYAG